MVTPTEAQNAYVTGAGTANPWQAGTPTSISSDYSYGSTTTGAATPTGYYDPNAKVWGYEQALAQQNVLGGFQEAQNQVGREGMATQIGLLNAQEGQEGGYLNQDYSLGNRRLDIQTGANARQPGFLTQLHDIAGRGFDLSRQENVAKNRQSNFELFNQSVAAGNVLMGGYGVQRGELAQQLMRNQAGVGLNQEEETARYNESLAKVADQASSLGLDREDLQNQLQRGLERLHLNTSMSVQDLLTKIQSSNLDDAIQARQRINDAWAASDAWAGLYPGAATVYGTTPFSGPGTYRGGAGRVG